MATRKVSGEPRKCQVEGCGRAHRALGYCIKHYWQVRKKGSIQPDKLLNLNKQEISKLYYDDELSAPEIAKIKKCSDAAIRKFLHSSGLGIRSKTEAHRLKYKKNPHPGILLLATLKPSNHIAYILGVLLGDGWVSKNKYNYKIGLSATELRFVQSFADAMKSIGLHPSVSKKIIKKENPIWKDQWNAEANSKQFYQWYLGLKMEHMEKITSDHGIHFLRGFYESEGSLAHRSKNNWRVTMYNSDKLIIDFVQKLLNRLSFRSSVCTHKRHGKKTEYAIRINGGQKETDRFFDLVNPCIKGL